MVIRLILILKFIPLYILYLLIIVFYNNIIFLLLLKLIFFENNIQDLFHLCI